MKRFEELMLLLCLRVRPKSQELPATADFNLRSTCSKSQDIFYILSVHG